MSQALNKSNGNSPSPNSVVTGPSPNLLNNQPNAAQPQQPYTPVFTTDKIQHTKATKPREYFDEQNRKTAEKKKQDNKNRKTIIIIGAAIIGALVLIGLVWLVIIMVSQPKGPTGQNIPSIGGDSDEEVSKVQQYLQNVYDDSDNSDTDNNTKLEAANGAAEEILSYGDNSEYADQINLARIMFYIDNGFYDEVIAESSSIDVDNLTLEQKLVYYNYLALAYQGVGDVKKSDEYFNLMYGISSEINGTGEYGDE